MEAPPSSERGGDKRGLGEQAEGWGSEGSDWRVSTMAWALLLVTLLTQGTGEASWERTPGTSG